MGEKGEIREIMGWAVWGPHLLMEWTVTQGDGETSQV